MRRLSMDLDPPPVKSGEASLFPQPSEDVGVLVWDNQEMGARTGEVARTGTAAQLQRRISLLDSRRSHIKQGEEIHAGWKRVLAYQGRRGNWSLTPCDYGLDRRDGVGGTTIIQVTHADPPLAQNVPDAEPFGATARQLVDLIRYGTEPPTRGRNSLPVLALPEAARSQVEDERRRA